MKCDNCDGPAKVHLTLTCDGKKVERHLCLECEGREGLACPELIAGPEVWFVTKHSEKREWAQFAKRYGRR